jgi:hypothetical protein
MGAAEAALSLVRRTGSTTAGALPSAPGIGVAWRQAFGDRAVRVRTLLSRLVEAKSNGALDDSTAVLAFDR